MRRTNIYLPDEQLDALRRLAEARGVPVADLVRDAISRWLDEEGVRVIDEDEWQRRFAALLERRRQIAAAERFDEDAVERDVTESIREVRKARAARRR